DVAEDVRDVEFLAHPGATAKAAESAAATAAEAAKATWGTAKAAAHAAGGDHGLQLVVFLALLLIAHDGVGLGSCLKAVLGRGIPGVLIRVVVPRDLAVGLLNLLGAGAFAHTEVLVIILVYPFTVHCLLPSFYCVVSKFLRFLRDAVRRCSGHTLTLNLESTALNFALPFDLNDSAGKVFLLLGFSARTVRLEDMTSRKPNWFERLFGQPAATSGAESTPVQQPDTAAFPDAASPNGEADGPPATPQNDAPQAPSEAPVSQMRDADFYAAMRVRLAPVKKELGVAPKGAFQFDKDSPVRPYADDLIVRLCL